MQNTSRIEAVLAAHPGIDRAAVVTVPGRSGGAPETVAALVAAGPTVPLAELRDHLSDHLPAAEHPQGFRWLPELPQAPAGDDGEELVRSLAAWWRRAPDTPPALTAATPLARVWWGELGRDTDLSDSGHGFLTLGGHSLLAVRLRARIAEELGVDVPLRLLLAENASLERLEAYVADAPRTARPAEPEPAPHLVTGPGGDRAPGPETGPLTPAQRRLHLLSHVMPDPSAYNVVGSLRLAGRPDRARLDAALAAVVRRHDLLRAEVGGPAHGEARLVYDRPVTPVWQTATGPEADADAFVRRIARQTIPLDRAPLFRAGLLECTDSDAVYLVLSVHHMVCDQHSVDLMFAGLAAAYAGAAPPGEAPRFADHARRAVADPDAVRGWPEDLEFWRRHLDGMPARSGLPFAPQPSTVPDSTGSGAVLRFDARTSDRIDALLRTHRATPATLLLACVGLVLSVWTSRESVVLGMPASVRRGHRDEDLFGFLLTTLPVRLDVGDQTDAAGLLRHAAERHLEAYEHGAPPFDVLADALGLAGDPTRNPLFQVWVNDVTRTPPPPRFGDLEATRHQPPGHAALFDLNFYLRREDGYRLELVHATDRVAGDVAREVLDQVGHALTRLLEEPDAALGPLGPVPDPAPALPAHPAARPLVDSVRARAADTPDAVAVEQDGAPVMTYRELVDRVDALTARLVSAGAAGGAVVDVASRRTPQLPVALLATWAAGAVPALSDAALPAARLREQRDAVRPCLLLDSATAEAVPRPVAGPTPGGRLPDASHILFTSGTSGHPAAVVAGRGVLEASLDRYAEEFAPGAADRVALLAGPGHDPLLRDLFVPLRAGGTLVVPPDGVFRSPDRLVRFLDESRITVLHATPALLELVTAAGGPAARLDALRLVVCGGAPLTAGLVRRLRRLTGARIVNAYGATETPQIASGATVAELGQEPDPSLPDTAVLPVGDGFGGNRLLVLDEAGRPVEPGRRGGVVVEGPRVALGYLDDGERGDAFTAGTGPGVRRFHTGDLGRRDPAGRVHIEGRADRQFLVDGFRVAPEEIEAAALSHDSVARALATFEANAVGGVLTLHVVPHGAALPDPDGLRTHLRRLLPAHAVPAVVRVVDRLGMDHNHKVSAAGSTALPTATATAAVDTAGQDGGRLAALAREVLGRDLGPDENFFDAGLTSIGLVRLHGLLRERLGLDVPVTELFARPTLSRLAAVLDAPADGRSGGADRRADRTAARIPGPGRSITAPPGAGSAARRRLDIRRHLYQDTGENS
ncbi:AMP-binding protein [Streptomyces sp. F63]|uniref:AMP-binding protein n=1 Tax=Streptomyces sp. F63 TaxID=2824887 RepID=UPI001B376836|nr:AMP-binding protein [Streptomyces sp. F63]MBQ0983202.1 AMP-binding protein [Streptomyces sp. F63]